MAKESEEEREVGKSETKKEELVTDYRSSVRVDIREEVDCRSNVREGVDCRSSVREDIREGVDCRSSVREDIREAVDCRSSVREDIREAVEEDSYTAAAVDIVNDVLQSLDSEHFDDSDNLNMSPTSPE